MPGLHADWWDGIIERASGPLAVALRVSRFVSGPPVLFFGVDFGHPPARHALLQTSYLEADSQHTIQVPLDVFVGRPALGRTWEPRRKPRPGGHGLGYAFYWPTFMFSPKTLRSVPATALRAGRPLIPAAAYPVPTDHETWCLGIAGHGDPLHVLIPMMEVLWFYYGTSVRLLKTLLSGPLALVQERLFVAAESGAQPNGTLAVTLEPGASDADTRLVACLAGSPVARRAAARIFDSLCLRWRQGPCACPDVFPPFEGPARLRLSGIWLEGDRNRPRFLGLGIESGTFPIPATAIERRRPEDRPVKLKRGPGGPGGRPLRSVRFDDPVTIVDVDRQAPPGAVQP